MTCRSAVCLSRSLGDRLDVLCASAFVSFESRSMNEEPDTCGESSAERILFEREAALPREASFR